MRRLLPLLSALAVTLPGIESAAVAQNSGERVRVAPGPVAEKAGSAIAWHTDLDAALAAAKEAGRPVFWYVPTIRGSFMDRKPEVDRAMMAGPFSWPRTVELLNEHFVPLKLAADKNLCERYDLERVRYIEPGYLVLDPEGTELLRRDRQTTLHPDAFLQPLRRAAGLEGPGGSGYPGHLQGETAEGFLTGFRGEAADERFLAALREVPEERKPEALFLRAAGAFWGGDERGATELWTAVTERFPGSVWAPKAAMELEGHGSIVRGLEVWGPLPAGALEPSESGTRVAEGVYDEAELWARSTRFLLAMQRSDGGWEDSIYDFGGTDGLPNVFVAVSAICTRALLERAARLDTPDPAVEAALARALGYLTDESNTNPQDTDEQIWAHLYRAQAFVRWLELRPDDGDAVRPALERVCATMIAMQPEDGAWFHEYPNPFVTADCLVALHQARALGLEITGLRDAVTRGTAALVRCRTEEGAFAYGNVRAGRQVRAAIEGGVGRIPRGELALTLWESESARPLDEAVGRSFEHEGFLLPAQKYDDHTRSHAYGGFFFWYDLVARTEALMALPDSPRRRDWIARQRAQVIGFAEVDGAFIDSHEIGRSYGTGMALVCLALLGE